MPRDVQTVLVVEDEALVRWDIAEFLEEAGYAVFEAADADEAIVLLVAHPNIRLVLTGIDMPGSMNGLRLAEAVRARWPPIEIIVASGHQEPRPDEIPTGGLFFRKPYSRIDVADAVRQLLSH